jgi:hypothetical protein
MIRLAKYWNSTQNRVYPSFQLEEYIVNLSYGYYTSSVFDYFAEFALSLPTYHLNGNARLKVERLQSTVNEIKNLRSQGNEYLAEQKLKRILPGI